MPEQASLETLDQMMVGSEEGARAVVSSSPGSTRATKEDVEAAKAEAELQIMAVRKVSDLMKQLHAIWQEMIDQQERSWKAKMGQLDSALERVALLEEAREEELVLQKRITASFQDRVIIVNFPANHQQTHLEAELHRKPTRS